jgi:hypothetical protein
MEMPQPTAEHKWLQQLVGEWTGEMECSMGPDQPTMTHKGTETVTSLGGLWTLGAGKGDMPDGSDGYTLMTLGYDPKRKKFVGSFVGSMMTNQWIYEGTLDAAGKVLTLDTMGPDFSGGSEGLVPYQDLIEFITPDHRTLSSQTKGPDGQWVKFMTGHYHRKK